MSNEFEWKTEEEAGWEEEIAVPETRPSRPLPWKPIGVFLLIAVLLAGGVRWQINRQVSAVTADVESEVRAAHLFLQRVAGQQDVDLLKSLLSGRDVNWVETQKALVVEGWFGNPPLLGGTAVPLTASNPLTVTLSPDLFTAEVQSEQSYQLLNPQGVTETVTLRQTAVYRKGESRWLYAPPEDEFWGRMVFHSGEYISVLYPERDEVIVQQLAQDLDDLVQTICRELATHNCLPRALVQVRFSKEPAILRSGVDTGSSLYILSLPTPSLLGLPVDEAGYQALFRAYGAAVATAVITQQVNYECCRWQLLYEALLDRQLHWLGLRPWPLNPAVYDQLALQPLTGGVMRLLIDRPSTAALDQMYLYAFVEFLESVVTLDVTLADMQQNLAQSQGVTAWVNQFASVPFANNAVDGAFFRHIIQHTTFAQASPPSVPLPGVIQMICNTGPFNDRVNLHEYNPETESWRELFREQNTPFWAYAQPIVTYPALSFLVEYLEETGEISYMLLEDGRLFASFTLDEGLQNFYLWSADPHGRYLLLSRWDIEDAPAQFLLVDVAACRQGDCRVEPVVGLMVWSPDGRYTITTLSEDLEVMSPSDDPPVIWLGDAVGENRQAVGVGQRPFWLDDHTYGYERLGEWVTAVVGENTPRHLLLADDLLAVIPEEQRPTSLFISAFTMTPNKPDQLLVQANASLGLQQFSYLFAISLTPDLSHMQAATLLFSNDSQGWFELSPDGRWLTIYSDGDFEGMTTTLRRLESGADQQLPLSQTYGRLSWSQDGQWYIQSGEGYLILGAPDYHYQQFVFHDHGLCEQAYWRE